MFIDFRERKGEKERERKKPIDGIEKCLSIGCLL